MNMKKVTIILLVLATVIVASGTRYSAKIVVDPASYTMPVDPNDAIFAVVNQSNDPDTYAKWQVQFGDSERTKVIYSASFNREVLVQVSQQVAALQARVTALEPVPIIDPNAAPLTPEDLGGTFVPLEDLPPDMQK